VSWAVDVVGAAALVVTATAVVPQTVRMVRVRSTAGVSPTWAMLGAVSTAVWTAYTAARGLWWATVADALACVSYLSSVVVLARHGIGPRLGAGALWLALFAAGHLVAGLDGVGTVLAFAFVVQVAPAIITAYRSADLLGASLLTWCLTLTEGALWFVYGWALDDLAVVAFGCFAVIAGGLMIWRISRARATGTCGRPVAHGLLPFEPGESRPLPTTTTTTTTNTPDDSAHMERTEP
jgi:uncharacterized protein with PQ loop repeat